MNKEKPISFGSVLQKRIYSRKNKKDLKVKTHYMSKEIKEAQTIIDSIVWNQDGYKAQQLADLQWQTKPEYACYYECFFEATGRQTFRITSRKMSDKHFVALYKMLNDAGFVAFKQDNDYKSFVHLEDRIMIGIGSEFYKEEDPDSINYNLQADAGYSSSSRNEKNPEYIYCAFQTIPKNKKFIEKFIKDIFTKYTEKYVPMKNNFYMIAQNRNGLYNQVTSCNPLPIKEDRYDLFYGEEFPHEVLKGFVEKPDNEIRGNLVLLHGDPGTGKSNYIKNIIAYSKRDVIYIPPSMLSVIASPDFIAYMLTNKNAILLIEDAEEVLSKTRNSATNNLLGLTDGFLKDAMNLRIIATFNCDASDIDPALKRKGRLHYQYKFDKLTVDECKKLAKFVGIPDDVSEPMTIAELFNPDENKGDKLGNDREMGFHSNPMLGG